MHFQTITLLNAITADAEADIEAPYTLGSGEAMILAQALATGYATIRSYAASDKTGTPVANLDSIQWSIDGTNYTNMFNFTDVDITPTGEHVVGQITTLNFPYTATKIRLQATVSGMDADNKLNAYTVSIACCF